MTTKKISVTTAGSSYQAQDALRPPALQTIDLKFDLNRLDAIFARFPSSILPSDYAADADNWPGRVLPPGPRSAGLARAASGRHHCPITLTTTRFLRWPSNSA